MTPKCLLLPPTPSQRHAVQAVKSTLSKQTSACCHGKCTESTSTRPLTSYVPEFVCKTAGWSWCVIAEKCTKREKIWGERRKFPTPRSRRHNKRMQSGSFSPKETLGAIQSKTGQRPVHILHDSTGAIEFLRSNPSSHSSVRSRQNVHGLAWRSDLLRTLRTRSRGHFCPTRA